MEQIFDKPMSMSVKDYLLRLMSIRGNISEKTLEAVVNHQFESAQKAMQVPDEFSVELSGFGKLFFNYKKAKKKLERNYSKEKIFTVHVETATSEAKKRAAKMKLESTLKTIEGLKPKVEAYETKFFSDLRRMEEQPISSQGDKGEDSHDRGSEDGNMQELQLQLGGKEGEIKGEDIKAG